MLILSRKKKQKIILAEGLIEITVVEIRGQTVRLGIVAPDDVLIDREEIHELRQAGMSSPQSPAAVEACP